MKYQIEEISKRIKIEKGIRKILKIFTLAILGILLIVNLIMLYQTSSQPDEVPSVFNLSFLNIISKSMVPTINVNDLIVIKKCGQDEINQGDIITYKKSDNSIVTHRIVKIEETNGENVYTTQGDGNLIEDDEKIHHNQVYGKYLFKIKGIGKLVYELQRNNGLISLAIILIIFVILKNGNDKKKEERKTLREKYDLKKKRDEYNKK